jgi:hypothetical protein
MLIVSLIFLNLFIAIILEGFFLSTQEQKIRISAETLELFKTSWTKFDPDATGMIPADKLGELVLDLTHKELLYRK